MTATDTLLCFFHNCKRFRWLFSSKLQDCGEAETLSLSLCPELAGNEESQL